ncbi:hypothetical protein BDZ45DRAFT_806086 [Acephala macrosclerotiorum]|nr:hypothetical protein BDZ45DRAFT_806086 [Acephala macrosclerotiorum]
MWSFRSFRAQSIGLKRHTHNPVYYAVIVTQSERPRTNTKTKPHVAHRITIRLLNSKSTQTKARPSVTRQSTYQIKQRMGPFLAEEKVATSSSVTLKNLLAAEPHFSLKVLPHHVVWICWTLARGMERRRGRKGRRLWERRSGLLRGRLEGFEVKR